MRITRVAIALLITGLALTACAPAADPEPSPPAETPVQPSSTPEETAGSGLSDDDHANISAAITSDNTAALEPYLADSVLVTIASTEFSEQRTPVEAITDLEYIQPVDDWTFPIDQAIVDQLVGSAYAQFIIGEPYGGSGPANEFVIFGAEDGKIVSIFQGLDVTLLLE